MTKYFILIVTLAWLNGVRSAEPQPLSLVFEEAPVERILQALADYQQVNLLVAPGVEGTLTLRLENVPWQQALTLVTRMAQLTAVQEDNVLLVFPQHWQQQEAELNKQREVEKQQQLPLNQKTVRLHYAEAEAVYRSLQQERGNLMSSRGSVTVDSRTNALLLRDTDKALASTERWLNALDIPLEQVELAAHIVTISEDHLRELGVNWRLGEPGSLPDALRSPRAGIPLSLGAAASSLGMTLARIQGQLLDLELSALEQENQIDIIASPRLFTAHQQTASIKQGTEIPYEVATGSSGSTTIEFKEAVLGMEVTPTVLGNGRIQLRLRLSQNVPGRSVQTGEKSVLAIDKQEIETQVILRDGQTLALGGIFQRQRSRGQQGVPGLAKLPLLGGLFRQQHEEQKKRELVIFITPRLVREAAFSAG
ncbi:DNA uptake porin HofQ [Candidatus Pantoea multigeneris]|uniref:DNA uptake porin HofQ n=1 Tax=Candidatus Pantoea multigeneris TaxID=2608357 RepID=A0ABX0RJ86_9GAMM|nr:DNA uptake porin HofQ [Pantoea multigeneris]